LLGGSTLPITAPVIGLIFGTDENSTISFCDATEAVYQVEGDRIVLNKKSIQKKMELWTAVYTHQRLVGWYSVSSELNIQHAHLHKEVSPCLYKNFVFH
jgi:hypothetical protein